MSLLLETLKIKGGAFCQVAYHNSRLNMSRKQLFGDTKPIFLENEIDTLNLNPEIIYKCRVLYQASIESVEFLPYTFPHIKTLKMLEADQLDYSYKYANRQLLNNLSKERGEADDILIIKNGRVTDTSFANLVFWDGEQWVTPNTPLHKGTKRQFYIDTKIIAEREIKPENIRSYEKVRIINALIDIDDLPDIDYIYS